MQSAGGSHFACATAAMTTRYTAGVWLDGQELFAPNFAHPDRPVLRKRGGIPIRRVRPARRRSICADGPIGCEPGEEQNFFGMLGGGDHELRIDVYQVGSREGNPFGVLYSGSATDNGTPTGGGPGGADPIPEPSAALLFACGAVVVSWRARRRK